MLPASVRSALRLGCLLLVLAAGVAISTPASAQPLSGRDVLIRTGERLERLRAVAFEQTLTLDYPSQSYHKQVPASVYMEADASTALGVRIRIESDAVVYAYNGSEAFYYDRAGNALDVTPHPGADDLPARFMLGSVYALRRALPALAADDSAEVVRVEGEAGTYRVEVRLQQRVIGSSGAIERLTQPLAVTYTVEVDSATWLPRAITKRDPNGDAMQTAFAAFDLSPAAPAPEAWYYSSLTNAATTPMGDGPVRTLVAVGAAAPPWTLAPRGSGDPVSLDGLRGRPALLVFWIAHCSHSIDAVPVVNALARAYAGRGVFVGGVNAYDAPELVGVFAANNRTAYPLLLGGESVAAAYGVSGYPTAVVVDADGRVAYAGDVDDAPLRAALDRLLGAR